MNEPIQMTLWEIVRDIFLGLALAVGLATICFFLFV